MQVLYGLHPVLELLKSGGKTIERIILAADKKGRPIDEITRIARKQGIPVTREDRSSLDRLAHAGNHQGVLARCREFAYSSLESILNDTEANHSRRCLLILDSITDPQNLGSLIRSAHCFGVRAVIIPKDRAAQVTPAVVKASAGSVLHTPICQVVNIAQTIEQLKEAGYWIYGADASGKESCGHLDYDGPLALVLGSEGSGLRPLVRQKCDYLVHIPMQGLVDSLNVSVAGGILLYEMTRK